MSLALFWANHVFLANPGKPRDYVFLAASGHGLAGFQAVSCLHHQAMLSRQSDDGAERWDESCRPSGAINHPKILLAFLPEIESLIPVISRPRLVIGESVGQQETNPARQSAGDG